MAKFTRDALKSLVKECLVEILSEGLSSPALTESVRRTPRPMSQREPDVTPARFVADRTSIGAGKSNQRPVPQRRAIPRSAIASITNDSVMQEMLADTANGTYQEQLAMEGPSSHGRSVPAQPAPPPIPAEVFKTELFEGASAWADLAFAPRVDPSSRILSEVTG